MRRGLATLFTLGLLFSFLLAVVLGLMLFVGIVSLPVAVAVVIVVNVVTLLVSPWFNDLIYGWLYDVEWVSPTRLRVEGHVVVVEKGDVFPGGHLESRISSPADSLIVLGVDGEVGGLCVEGLENLEGPVGRPIVNTNDVFRRIRLVECRVYCRLDKLLRVVARDHDRYRGFGRHLSTTVSNFSKRRAS
jgi:hypothetical protein